MASKTTAGDPYPRLLTKKQAARFFSVSVRTLDRWMHDDVLPTDAKIVVGGSVRFRSDVLMTFITCTPAECEGGLR